MSQLTGLKAVPNDESPHHPVRGDRTQTTPLWHPA